MATVQISKRELETLNMVLKNENANTSNNFTKKEKISHAINIFYDHLNESLLNQNYTDLCATGISDTSIKQLRQAKLKYHKPMYVIASACVRSYLNNLKGLEKVNIALVKFAKSSKKIYAFYFDSAKLNIQRGDIVKVRTKTVKQENVVETKCKVIALGYEENAIKIHKPVIDIIQRK